MPIITSSNITTSNLNVTNLNTNISNTELNYLDGTSSNIQTQLSTGVWNPSQMPSGSVIQVVNTIYTGRTSYTIYTSDTAVPGGSLSITPKLSGSKFLIRVRYWFENTGGWDTVYNIQRAGVRINVGGMTQLFEGIHMATQTYQNADDSSTPDMLSFETLDTTGSTAGSALTYTLVSSSTSNRTGWVNRTFGSDGQNGHERGTSEIIIMEIKG